MCWQEFKYIGEIIIWKIATKSCPKVDTMTVLPCGKTWLNFHLWCMSWKFQYVKVMDEFSPTMYVCKSSSLKEWANFYPWHTGRRFYSNVWWSWSFTPVQLWKWGNFTVQWDQTLKSWRAFNFSIHHVGTVFRTVIIFIWCWNGFIQFFMSINIWL